MGWDGVVTGVGALAKHKVAGSTRSGIARATNLRSGAFLREHSKDGPFATLPSMPVELSVHAQDGTATIEARDGGPGIPPDELPVIFDRFHRGRGRTAGGGLGLALCKEIVARHRGDIAVESAVGTGTTVAVTFPVPTVGCEA
jgi:light-regulated signal transduction histidine kinase (bacteriophytochrome)